MGPSRARATPGHRPQTPAPWWTARWLGYDRLHRLAGRRWFFIISQDDLARGQQQFQRHGSWIVAVSRCVPVLRSIVSLPAGVGGMPLVRFSVLTLNGSGVWNAAFVAAGWLLAEQYHQVERYLGPASLAVTCALLLGAAVLARRRHRTSSTTPQHQRSG
jgi:membrane protein DedA with SNARE-associated domain